MFRGFGIAIFTVLVAGSVSAQRGGVAFHGAASASAHSGTSARGFHGSFSPGFSGRFSEHFSDRRSHHNRTAGYWYPDYWLYDEPYGYGEPYADEPMREPAPVAVRAPVPQAPIEPKLIEVPGAADAAVAKQLPPAIFILTSGERLESNRFVLRASDVAVTVNRQRRTIALSDLNVDATLAANHERGVELEIPTDPNQISLRF